MQKKWIHDSKW